MSNAVPILVPVSPSKDDKLSLTLERRYAEQRQDAFYGTLMSTTVQPPGTRENLCERPIPTAYRPTSFVASSARASRKAIEDQKRKKAAQSRQKSRYSRDINAAFEPRNKSATQKPALQSIENETGDKRDDSLQLVENLVIGPKVILPSNDDLHFLKMEPTSGIALRKRYISHEEFESHLEGRYYLSISTLYSISQLGQSDDGDYTLPVDADWLTMGVITSMSQVLKTKEKRFDANGQMIMGNGKTSAEEADLSMLQDSEGDVVKGVGQGKTLGPKNFVVVTLTDLSKRPNKFGEHDGSQEVELSVFQSDNTWLEAGGVRKYSGGSSGAYEKIRSAGLGALICILNPRIKAAKAKDRSDKLFRLNPRAGNTIMVIGMASDYLKCSAGNCENFVDKRTKVDVCTFHINNRLDRTRNGRPELQNSWRQATRSSNPYALSDGLSLGSKTKSFTFNTNDSQDPNDCSSRQYDVHAHYGRAKEERMLQEDKLKELVALKKRLTQSSKGLVKKNLDGAAGGKDDGELRLEMMLREKAKAQASIKTKNCLDLLESETAGSKVIEAARKAMHEKKRQAERALQKQGKAGLGKRAKSCSSDDNADVPTGSFRALNGDVKKLTPSSSKLLARHSADLSSLPKPVLRRKKIKLPPTVKAPPGESFYASESSDEELENIMRSEALREHLQEMDPRVIQDRAATSTVPISDSESDLEIIPSRA